MVMSLKQIQKAHDNRDDFVNLRIKLGRIRLSITTSKSVVFFNNMSIERMKRNRSTTGCEALAFTVTPLEDYPHYIKLTTQSAQIEKELAELELALADTEAKLLQLKQ